MADERDPHAVNREVLRPWRAALYDYEPASALAAADAVFAPRAEVHLAFPFEDLDGGRGFVGDAIAKLGAAMPDLERRDTIVIAGDDPYGHQWVGCCGYYTGTWVHPFLDIPPTGHQAAMRFHEFYRMVEGHVTEVQALWDIAELMMQAGAWPMGPSLGADWSVPGPATQDGLADGPRDRQRTEESVAHVIAMLGDMGRYPTEGPDVMRLEHWWHPRFSWYGPAGIGTTRGVSGFRHWHQIPFVGAMPDRSGGYAGESHFFGEGNYVGVTGWPGMSMTLTSGDWLGIAGNGQPLTMRSLDFWRLEDTVRADGSTHRSIRENWVLVDLLSVWDQLGVDVLARMRELTAGPSVARRAFG